MGAPNYEGSVTLPGGVALTFDFKAISALQREHGLEEWVQVVSEGVDLGDVERLAYLITVTGGVDLETAQGLCVPMLPAREALGAAWRAAWTGNTELEEGEEPGKKRMLGVMLSGLLSGLHFGPASRGATSGA